MPHKEYHDWKNMKDEDFLYSIYPNDLLYIKSSTPKKFTKKKARKKIPLRQKKRLFIIERQKSQGPLLQL